MQHDAEVIPYLNSFVQDAATHGREAEVKERLASVSVVLVDSFDTPDVIGRCSLSTLEDKVEFLRSHFKRQSHYRRMSLVYHELGHCVLGITEHTQGKLSIMNSPYIAGHLFALFEQALLLELFRPE